MSGVSGATSKSPHASSSSSHSSSSSSSSSSTNKSSESKKSNASNQANEARESLKSNQSNQSKDSFESGSDKSSKKKVDLGGGQGSAQASHDLKTGETKKSGGVDVAHVDASASESTDPVAQRDDQADIAPNTTASNHAEVGKGEVGVDANAGADDKGVHANVGVHGELTAAKDELSVENNTQLLDGERPLNTENKLDGSVAARVEGHANAEAYADKDGNAGGHINVGGTAGIDGQLTGSSTLSTVDDQGNKEELASGSITLHGNIGVSGGLKAGFDFKDGKLSTELGFNFTPGAGGGVDTKLSVDLGNIAKEGQKIAEEIGKGAGDLGYQAQQQLGETFSGIQKFFGGVQIFG